MIIAIDIGTGAIEILAHELHRGQILGSALEGDAAI